MRDGMWQPSQHFTDRQTTIWNCLCTEGEMNLRQKQEFKQQGNSPEPGQFIKEEKNLFWLPKPVFYLSELESPVHCHSKSSTLQLLFYLKWVNWLFSDPENVSFSTGCSSANHYLSTCCYTQNIHPANNSSSN